MDNTFKIRTFGRKKSRKLSDNKNNILTNILPQYEICIKNNKIINFPEQKEDKKILLEIGFGYGEQIINQAILHKDYNLIGCETYINGVISLINKIKDNNINNIKIFKDDARVLLETLPDNSIDIILLLFPDPWPKKRQNKRRILNENFLSMIKNKIKPNGTFFFASDIFDYVEQSYNITKLSFEPLFNTLEECIKEPDWWIKTRYQQKAINNNRKCYFLEFKNTKK